MTPAPWDFLFTGFNTANFPSLHYPIIALSLIFLVGQVILYNVRTRQLRRFPLLVALQEWLLWTGVVTFSLLLIEALFVFYFFFVLLTIVIGLAAYVWVRFLRFPPLIAAYNEQLRRTRFFSQSKYRHPEATITTGRRRRRR